MPDMMHGGRVMGDTCVAVTTVSRGPVWILLAASDMSAAADATAAGVHVKAYPSLSLSACLSLSLALSLFVCRFLLHTCFFTVNESVN